MPTKKQILIKIHDRLFLEYGKVDCPLQYSNNFQLLVAVILSAQCTDIRVNQVTTHLFKKFPNAETMSKALLNEIEEIIKPVGLYHSKASSIHKTSQILIEKHNGEIPQTIDELVTFPGIGRKTANVIINHAYDQPGFAVDTHVIRLLNKIGIVKTKEPEKIEFFVKEQLSDKYLINLSLLLITHGRNICKAANPKCNECVIKNECSFFKNNKSKES